MTLCLAVPAAGYSSPLITKSAEGKCETRCDGVMIQGKKPVLTWGETSTRPLNIGEQLKSVPPTQPKPESNQQVVNSRYKTTIKPVQPQQIKQQDIRPPVIDTLSIYVRVVFPDNVKTVGDAVEYLIEPTGYRLATSYPAPRDASLMVSKRLPPIIKIERTMPVIDALQILIGVDNTIVVDPVHKLISFSKGH